MGINIDKGLFNTIPNIFDIEKEMRNIYKGPTGTSIASALAFRAKDAKYNAEFEGFYEKSEALRLVAKKHSWTRATVSSIARAAVGAGFSFVRHPVFGRNQKIIQEEMDRILEPVYDFFYGIKDVTRYIQDTVTLPAKIFYTVVSLIYYGQASWELIYDSETGKPIGFDVLAGIVRPNVNEHGRFLRPAYYFRPWNSTNVISYRNPSDIVYITWPGIDLSIYGSSEYDAVAEISIPSDLYASTAYRNHFENINAPYNGVWIVDKDTSKEDYKQFLMTLVNRYSGVVNFGRTPIVIRGDVDFKETRSRSNDDAPYLEGRKYNQEEISAVSAVPSAKLGLAANATKTNYREMRRDFHENTLRPIFEIIEHAIYQQVFVRGFGMKDWMMVFNSPDLTTSLEQATILTRYVQNGLLNPNEARGDLGRPPREDSFGTVFYHPNNSIEAATGGKESHTANIGDPNQTVEENREPEGGSMRQTNNVRVPSSDAAHTGQESLRNIVNEIKTWRNFALRVAEGKRTNRSFIPIYLNQNTAKKIQTALDVIGNDSEQIKSLFNDILYGHSLT